MEMNIIAFVPAPLPANAPIWYKITWLAVYGILLSPVIFIFAAFLASCIADYISILRNNFVLERLFVYAFSSFCTVGWLLMFFFGYLRVIGKV